jgi:hypothetical protein
LRKLGALARSLTSKDITINHLRKLQNKWEEMRDLIRSLLKPDVYRDISRDLLNQLISEYERLKKKAEDLSNIQKWLKTLGIHVESELSDLENIKLRDFEESIQDFEERTALDATSFGILSFFLRKKSALFDASVHSAVLAFHNRVI